MRAQALASTNLPEPDWGDAERLTLVIVLSGSDFKIEPHYHEIVLPRRGETEPVFFQITPTNSPSALLRISIYLARELTLLEEFELPIGVQQAASAA